MSFCRYPLTFKMYKDSLYTFCYLTNRHTSKTSNRNVYQSDAIESYTDHLLQENSRKWSDFIIKLFSKEPLLFGRSNAHKNLEPLTLNNEDVQSKIIDNIVDCNIKKALELVKFCRINSYKLSSDFMLYLIKVFATSGSKEGVETVLSLYRSTNENEFKENCGFEHYKALVLWYNGNIEKSFEILERLYLVNKLRHNVNCIMYDIINNSVIKNEAVLVLTTNFTQKLLDTYHNFYPLSILWKTLTISDCYADQRLAKELLFKNEELKMVICPLIPLWSVQLIQCNNIDAVHRMCEVLLEHDDLRHYSSVLHSLFDYYYKYGNLKRCSAIIRSAVDLDLELKKSYQQRFLKLLTTGKPDMPNNLFKKAHKQINYKF